MQRCAILLALSVAACALLTGCGSEESPAASGGGAGKANTSGGSGGSGGTEGPADCSQVEGDSAIAVCAAKAFLSALSADERTAVVLDFSSDVERTQWSNLPGVTRAGSKLGDLSAAARGAALTMMETVLSGNGASDLLGILAADDYLAEQDGEAMQPPGEASQYSSDNYYVAVFGTPALTGHWALAFGGHHLAYNITYVDGAGYPTPNHVGVEPKEEFTINGETYAPLSDEGQAMLHIFKSLSAEQLETAYLEGQTFADVLVGPVEYSTGSDDAAVSKFPTGENRGGVLVSDLSEEQQDRVAEAILTWVDDYSLEIADTLLADYTTAEALADTYVAWGGDKESGVDLEVNGTYMRIDGPRVWIEVSCQSGVVIQGKTHFHNIFRDKAFDYAGTL